MSTIKISDDHLTSFYEQNPNFDILKFDFSRDEANSLNGDNQAATLPPGDFFSLVLEPKESLDSATYYHR